VEKIPGIPRRRASSARSSEKTLSHWTWWLAPARRFGSWTRRASVCTRCCESSGACTGRARWSPARSS